MSDHLQACGPDDDLETAHTRMGELQVRRLPVVDGDQLVGIISLNDLALAAAAQRGGNALERVGRTLAAICEHRQADQPVRAA